MMFRSREPATGKPEVLHIVDGRLWARLLRLEKRRRGSDVVVPNVDEVRFEEVIDS